MNARPGTSLPFVIYALVAASACGQPRPSPDPAASATTASASTGSAATTASAAGSAAPGAQAPCPEGAVHIAAGTFRMGSPPEEKDADPDERPVREVTLRAFCLGRTEVTVDQYARCVAEPHAGLACTPASATVVSRALSADDVLFWSKFCNAGRSGAGAHPVNCVDWKQADTYCRWAGGRLPSEAEWERAARGDDGRKYPWGNEPPAAERLNACGAECSANAQALGRKDKKSMFDGNDGAQTTAPVGQYAAGASPFGALDMAGNVWEWTADGYAPYDPTLTDNPVQAARPSRVVRGGHWLNVSPGSPRTANRESRPEERRLEDVGFRCAFAPLQR